MPLIFKDDELLFVSGVLAMHEDCCCETPLGFGVTFGNMLSKPTATQGFGFGCMGTDPYSRLFCSDLAVDGVTPRYLYSLRNYTALNNYYAITDPGATFPFTAFIRDFETILRYWNGSVTSCGSISTAWNFDDEEAWSFLLFSVSASGVSTGPGNVTFTAKLVEMSAASPGGTEDSIDIGRWTKTIALAGGQYYRSLGSVALDVDTSTPSGKSSLHRNSDRTGHSNGGVLSCNATGHDNYGTCTLHL